MACLTSFWNFVFEGDGREGSREIRGMEGLTRIGADMKLTDTSGTAVGSIKRCWLKGCFSWLALCCVIPRFWKLWSLSKLWSMGRNKPRLGVWGGVREGDWWRKSLTTGGKKACCVCFPWIDLISRVPRGAFYTRLLSRFSNLNKHNSQNESFYLLLCPK